MRLQLTRKQSLIVALGAIAVFFAVTFILIRSDARVSARNGEDPEQARLIAYYKGTTEQPASSAAPSAQPSPAAEAGPQSSPAASEEPAKFALNEFYRSETKDGRKLWEVRARTGQYYPETNSAKLSAADMHFYRPNGEVVQLLANEAVLYLTGPVLTKAEGTHGVTMLYNNRLTVKTEHALYDRAAGTIHAPGHVDISSATLDTSGDVLDVDIEKKTMTLSRNVHTLVKPKQESEDNDA